MELQEEIQEQPNEFDVLAHLPISEEEAEILAENGFDDVDSLKFLDLNTLVALGISDPQAVYDACQDLLSQFVDEGEVPQEEQEEEEGEQQYQEDGEQEYEYDGQQLGQDVDDQQSPEKIVNIEVKSPKIITQAMIIQTLQSQQSKLSNAAAANYLKTMKGQHLQQTLQKLTHLHLNNKRLQRIGEDIQKLCGNLRVLYLFDNYIDKIDGLNTLKNIVQLSLYNNQITIMEGFDGLPMLKKLYLEKNRISRLEGLTACRQLEELYLSQQDTQSDFSFDEYSLAAIAGSLKYLDLSQARVSEPMPLYYLERVEVLILKKNRIVDFEDQVCPMLQTMNALRQLDLTDNPVTQIPKYRDQVIILTGQRLQEIDNKKVTQQERSYLMQLVQRKQRTAMGGPTEKKEEVKHAKTANFEIAGKNKTIHMQSDLPMHTHTQMYQMAGTQNGSDSETQNQFYSPLDDNHKGVFKQRTNIANISYQNNANVKKRSVNLNGNADFSAAGLAHQGTKHVPSIMGGAGMVSKVGQMKR
ncbi:hypothetical protein FGO68_gene9687 [Halteria grandinella]|uniref:Uncharacterized protein n=1 Tax=Halteria grandinella TaxID=5974 RepID=A0A8J8TBB7_HALGN|nr:hypothetical protein FGO68_gene9687 [Halteria grandinella]